MKITHVAEIVNIRHVARILEAEICGAENVCAILMYNQFAWYRANVIKIFNRITNQDTCVYYFIIIIFLIWQTVLYWASIA